MNNLSKKAEFLKRVRRKVKKMLRKIDEEL